MSAAVCALATDTSMNVMRSTTMSLLHEDLARARWRDAERRALLDTRAARIIAARRWQRRAEHASRRARLALAAVH